MKRSHRAIMCRGSFELPFLDFGDDRLSRVPVCARQGAKIAGLRSSAWSTKPAPTSEKVTENH
jgi:hypothetical protein